MPLLSYYHPNQFSEEQHTIDKRISLHALFVSLLLLVALWIIKLVEFEYGLDFSSWGIHPRDPGGLKGILFSPLIHGNFEHLGANTLPLLVLTFSLFFFYRKSAYILFFLLYFFSGAFVWLAGRDALHIGASGLIYGLAAFLFLGGVLSRNIGLLTISLIVALLYGGLIWGVFPVKPEISWEAHLWGGLTGFALAWFFRRSAPANPVEPEENEDDPNDNEWKESLGEEEGTRDDPGDLTTENEKQF